SFQSFSALASTNLSPLGVIAHRSYRLTEQRAPAGIGDTVTDAFPRTRGSATDVAVITASPLTVRHCDRTTPPGDTVATVVSLDDQRTAADTPASASTIARICSVKFGKPKPIPGVRNQADEKRLSRSR